MSSRLSQSRGRTTRLRVVRKMTIATMIASGMLIQNAQRHG
jgi:hypothetical protein